MGSGWPLPYGTQPDAAWPSSPGVRSIGTLASPAHGALWTTVFDRIRRDRSRGDAFMPGDSLLFVVGTLCGAGNVPLQLAIGLLSIAAVAGDQINHRIGWHFGSCVFRWKQSRFFNKRAFDRAYPFYDRYGGVTIILAHFMPFIRTFAPFVAGVAEINRTSFTVYYAVGGRRLGCRPHDDGLPLRQHRFCAAEPKQAALSVDTRVSSRAQYADGIPPTPGALTIT